MSKDDLRYYINELEYVIECDNNYTYWELCNELLGIFKRELKNEPTN